MSHEQDQARLKSARERLGKTQEELDELIGVKRARYSHWENGIRSVPLFVWEKLNSYGVLEEVSSTGAAAGELEVPLRSIGHVNASQKVDWTDPLECEDMVFVPGHMADRKGRFACIAVGDSMMPLIQPGDRLVFQRTDIPKIGAVVLFRSFDNRITIKTLKHDGSSFSLRPENKAYTEEPAEGSMVGYLVGIVRKMGKRVQTDYDEDGIRPGIFT